MNDRQENLYLNWLADQQVRAFLALSISYEGGIAMPKLSFQTVHHIVKPGKSEGCIVG